MIIAGLTGSIGAGKSTAAARFRALGYPVFDADAEVHKLYEGRAAGLIEAAFPGTTAAGRVDRQKLAAALLRTPGSFKRLEAIVHPLVQEAERAFLHAAAARGARLAVLEIPLLFETGSDRKVDSVIVVSASSDVQRARVMARTGMTAEKYDGLAARQTPDAEKRRRADFIVDTNGTIEACERQVDAMVPTLLKLHGRALRRHWS